MAIHDYVIANQNGANTRSDLNNALAAIVSNNSSATEPTTTYAFMWWADTAADILKQRNAADSAWINILTLSTGAPLGTLSSSLLSGALPAIDGSALTGVGKVLQVVQATETAEYTATHTSGWAKTGVNLVITPTSTSSKILLMGTTEVELQYANSYMVIDFHRAISGGTTTTNITGENRGLGVSTDLLRYVASPTYLDSPATTSAITYNIAFKWDSGGVGQIYLGGTTDITALIAMEIE